jgi:hypothetical protein
MANDAAFPGFVIAFIGKRLSITPFKAEIAIFSIHFTVNQYIVLFPQKKTMPFKDSKHLLASGLIYCV